MCFQFRSFLALSVAIIRYHETNENSVRRNVKQTYGFCTHLAKVCFRNQTEVQSSKSSEHYRIYSKFVNLTQCLFVGEYNRLSTFHAKNVRLYHLDLHQVTSSVKEMWSEENVPTSLAAGSLEVFA